MGIFTDILDIVYPETCPGCGKAISESAWCKSCVRKFWNPRMISSSPSKYLWGCYTLCNYIEGVRKVLIRLKYGGKREMKKAFPELLDQFPWQERLSDCSKVIPVPLAKDRRKERGYNQVDLIFQEWMENNKRNYMPDAMIRMRNTNTQSLLSKSERYANIKGVFHINKGVDVRGENILLVDDIYTTGATMEAAAHELKRAGSGKIVGLTIASGAK